MIRALTAQLQRFSSGYCTHIVGQIEPMHVSNRRLAIGVSHAASVPQPARPRPTRAPLLNGFPPRRRRDSIEKLDALPRFLRELAGAAVG